MTKIRNMSRTPAATENCPKSKKMLVKVSPPSSASSIASLLTGSAASSFSRNTGPKASMVPSVPAPPSTAGPSWVTRTELILPSSPTRSCNRPSGMTMEAEAEGFAPRSYTPATVSSDSFGSARAAPSSAAARTAALAPAFSPAFGPGSPPASGSGSGARVASTTSPSPTSRPSAASALR
ncbi:MAG: hypothetical protein AVDCRST_MAG05-4241 [uncultured Rubrobacteraceae bacterium]|uniref:Uncharacterized protein n=1 Tax=uncultured Rubrobacteraceae bacterium TaxID=349277 RepID=A0A6J4TPU2_9ACTN|nr:MAG: hypothetical protein AVDCRST_MAG05-4241 [uncultured Rubrobacteraceae bacterium]